MRNCSPAQPSVAPLWPTGLVPTDEYQRKQSQASLENTKNDTSHPNRNQAVIRTVLLLVTFFCWQAAVAQRCLLIPNNPVAVPTGGGYSFSEISCGTNIVWSLTGQGTLDQSGNYSAPTSVRAQNQDHGCQVSP